MGLYELKFCGEKVPPKVAINEAVELAKAFGSDNSSRFINGVLGTAFRQIDPEAATKDNNEQPKDTKAGDKQKTESETPESTGSPAQETV